jgi:hypothetical protein
VPLLFPIDLLLLVSLGAFTAMASLLLGAPARFSENLMPLLVILPVVYMACDLAENCLLTRIFLLSQSAVSQGMVNAALLATRLKLFIGGAAILQVIVLGAVAYRNRG